VAALALSSMPIWVALVAGLSGKWQIGSEWIGLAIGLAGVAVLQSAGDLRASAAGAVMLVLSCATWSLGSILSSRMTTPRGPMTNAMQMLMGGLVVLAGALARCGRVRSL